MDSQRGTAAPIELATKTTTTKRTYLFGVGSWVGPRAGQESIPQKVIFLSIHITVYIKRLNNILQQLCIITKLQVANKFQVLSAKRSIDINIDL